MQQRDRHRLEDLEDIVKSDAATIEALRAENARLREALKPFTAKFDEEGWQAIQTAKDSDWFRWVCTAGEIRAARTAIGETDSRINPEYTGKRMGGTDD